MAGRDIIVIGASAGGVDALMRLVTDLPADLPAAIFVVCHFPPEQRSHLPEILSRRGALTAHHAEHGEAIRPGRIYVAPRDYHLHVLRGMVKLDRGARENRFRPAIDPLFRTAARAYGPRVIGVILSGMLYDGAAGLLAVRSAGGAAVVQDPADALMPPMPATALQIAGADHVVPVAQMGALLDELCRTPLAIPATEPRAAFPPRTNPSEPRSSKGEVMADPTERASAKAAQDMAEQQAGERRGDVSVFTCPECGGALWQVDDAKLLGFRCHTGHAYYAEKLFEEQGDGLEAALWSAVRIFKERTVLGRQLAQQAQAQNNPAAAARFEDDARAAEEYSNVIHEYLLQGAAPLAAPAVRSNRPRALETSGPPRREKKG